MEAKNDRPIFDLFKILTKRVLVGNFQVQRALDDEREALAGARKPIKDAMAQDYVAWRRAVLWLAALTMAIHAVISFFGWLDDLDVDLSELEARGLTGTETILKFLGSALYWRIPITAVLIFVAAKNWTDVKDSRRFARYAGILYFLSAIVLAVIPWSSFTGGDGMSEQLLVAARVTFGAIAGLSLFVYVAPVPIGVLSGVVRSSMVLKTLLPESPATGWGAVLYLPIYLLVIVSLMVVVMQIAGGMELTIGLACILASALTILMKAKDIVRPCSVAELPTRVLAVRNKARLFTTAGVILIVVFALDAMIKISGLG
jgi:hypothetical protein